MAEARHPCRIAVADNFYATLDGVRFARSAPHPSSAIRLVSASRLLPRWRAVQNILSRDAQNESHRHSEDEHEGELLDTIRLVHGGAKWIQAEVASSIATHVADTALTDREVEVLGLIAHGKSNKLIAYNLSIHEETAKTHVKRILAKLHANDRTHAVTLALRRGIILL